LDLGFIMEEDNEFNEDERFYTSDFKDNLEYLLGLKDILHGAFASHGTTSSTTYRTSTFVC